VTEIDVTAGQLAAAGITSGGKPVTLDQLAAYQRRPEVIRSPREIVAEIHEKIAAKSQRHAELVEAFERLPKKVRP